MVYVYGLNVVTTDKDTVIATVKNEYRPKVPVRSFFGYGSQSGAWGLLVINSNGDVTVTHKYSSRTLTWNMIDISVSYVY